MQNTVDLLSYSIDRINNIISSIFPSLAKVQMQVNQSVSLAPLSKEFDSSQCVVQLLPENIRKWTGREQFAVTIENALTPEECKQWIEDTEARGYEQALVNIGNNQQKLMTDYRNSARCIIDDDERAQELWRRIAPLLPKEYRNYQAEGLNERLRFLRYDHGEFFLPHCDGSFFYPEGHPKEGMRSQMTLLLYLNSEFEGGTTRFFVSPTDESIYYDCPKKPGTVIIFDHRMLHSGELVVNGRKYAVRTDVMFSYDN